MDCPSPHPLHHPRLQPSQPSQHLTRYQLHHDADIPPSRYSSDNKKGQEKHVLETVPLRE